MPARKGVFSVKKNISFAYKGAEREKLKDVYYQMKNDKVGMIGLCDGVSTQKYSDVGAYEVQKAIWIMLEKMVDFSNITKYELKFRIGCVINETLYRLSKQYECEEECFASTLMLVIFAMENDFYWTVHIGDGVIGIVDDNSKVKILSSPENGVTKQYTYTTTSGNLMKRIRIEEHYEKGFVFMMTDGISNELERNKKYIEYLKTKNWKRFENELLSDNISDDIGFNGMDI